MAERVNKYCLNVLLTPRRPPTRRSVSLLIAIASHIATDINNRIELKPLKVSGLAPSLVPAVTVLMLLSAPASTIIHWVPKEITMPDLLVNLLKLPSLDRLSGESLNIRRAQPFEITPVREFIQKHFSVAWADEISVGFANKPITVYLATREQRVIGFAGYECTRKAFFGPTGVDKSERGRGIGKALLIAALQGLRELGYVYGIIGAAGPVEFYEEVVGAIVIPNSEPGIYTDLLK